MKEEGETERDICRGPTETESGKINRGRQLSEGQFQSPRRQYSDVKAERRMRKKREKIKLLDRLRKETENSKDVIKVSIHAFHIKELINQPTSQKNSLAKSDRKKTAALGQDAFISAQMQSAAVSVASNTQSNGSEDA